MASMQGFTAPAAKVAIACAALLGAAAAGAQTKIDFVLNWVPGGVEANGALKFDNALTDWKLVETLIKPFDVKSAYTNEFLDRTVRMVK
jgi:hypothetical protein